MRRSCTRPNPCLRRNWPCRSWGAPTTLWPFPAPKLLRPSGPAIGAWRLRLALLPHHAPSRHGPALRGEREARSVAAGPMNSGAGSAWGYRHSSPRALRQQEAALQRGACGGHFSTAAGQLPFCNRRWALGSCRFKRRGVASYRFVTAAVLNATRHGAGSYRFVTAVGHHS